METHRNNKKQKQIKPLTNNQHQYKNIHPISNLTGHSRSEQANQDLYKIYGQITILTGIFQYILRTELFCNMCK